MHIKKKVLVLGVAVTLSCLKASMPPDFNEDLGIQPIQPLTTTSETLPAPAMTPQTGTSSLAWQPEELDSESITTGTHDQQNWLKTLGLFRKANPLYEQIRTIVEAINDSKTIYFDEHTKVSNELGQFYIIYSFKGGEVEEQMNTLVSKIQELREKQGTLTEEQRTLLVELTDKHKLLEQLKSDLLLLHDLVQKSLAEGFSQLLKQADVARSYEEKALNNYEHISEAPNDEIAERLYREMEAFLQNVKLLQNYVQGDFKEYFNKTITLIRTSMDKIKQRVDDLKERGVVLLKEVQETLKEKVEKEVPVKPQEPITWTETIVSWFKALWHYITLPFKAIAEWFSGKEEIVKPLKRKEPTKAVESTDQLITATPEIPEITVEEGKPSLSAVAQPPILPPTLVSEEKPVVIEQVAHEDIPAPVLVPELVSTTSPSIVSSAPLMAPQALSFGDLLLSQSPEQP